MVYSGSESGVFLLPHQLVVTTEPEKSSPSKHSRPLVHSRPSDNSSQYYKTK